MEEMENQNASYILHLEKQCEDWEEMYEEMKAERDMWKARCEQKQEPKRTSPQIRHV